MNINRHLMTLFTTLAVIGTAPGLAMADNDYCSQMAEKLYKPVLLT